jgi:hypothetical protein
MVGIIRGPSITLRLCTIIEGSIILRPCIILKLCIGIGLRRILGTYDPSESHSGFCLLLRVEEGVDLVLVL